MFRDVSNSEPTTTFQLSDHERRVPQGFPRQARTLPTTQGPESNGPGTKRSGEIR